MPIKVSVPLFSSLSNYGLLLLYAEPPARTASTLLGLFAPKPCRLPRAHPCLQPRPPIGAVNSPRPFSSKPQSFDDPTLDCWNRHYFSSLRRRCKETGLWRRVTQVIRYQYSFHGYPTQFMYSTLPTSPWSDVPVLERIEDSESEAVGK